MGKGSLAPHPLLWKCYKVYAKRSVDELFMHYFHNMLSASGGFAPRLPPGLPSLDPAGDPNLPTPGKNPAGAHAVFSPLSEYIGPA